MTRGGRTRQYDDAVLALIEQGVQFVQIAKRVGINKNTVYGIRDRLLRAGAITDLDAKNCTGNPDKSKNLEAGRQRRTQKIRDELVRLWNETDLKPAEMVEKIDRDEHTIYKYLNILIEEGKIQPDRSRFFNGGMQSEEAKWYKIIERVGQELEFYRNQGVVPTLRKMYYRLIELGVIEKSKANYNGLAIYTAEARRGVDSTLTKETNLPRLPIDCFVDEGRDTIGDTDIDSKPEEPTPDKSPQDPEEYIDGVIQEVKDAPDNYDGEIEEGEDGVMPGKWYKQPIYCEIWCESKTIQRDLKNFQEDWNVPVASVRGYSSQTFMYETCSRLANIASEHQEIEKIVILYFGDSDETGEDIRRHVEDSITFYNGGGGGILASDDLEIGVEVEVRHVLITPEQVEEYGLTGYQMEAFMTTEELLEAFKQILNDAIAECWDEELWESLCPPEEYDYEANEEEEPEDIDPDNGVYDLDTGETFREMMVRKITEAFRPGWYDEDD